MRLRLRPFTFFQRRNRFQRLGGSYALIGNPVQRLTAVHHDPYALAIGHGAGRAFAQTCPARQFGLTGIGPRMSESGEQRIMFCTDYGRASGFRHGAMLRRQRRQFILFCPYPLRLRLIINTPDQDSRRNAENKKPDSACN